MKATTLLERQHHKVKAALKKLSRPVGHDTHLVEEVASELVAHMVIEETIFYPAVRRVRPELVAEAYEEHALAQVALKRLLATQADDPRRCARASALYDLLEHHIDEEQNDLFPKVEHALDDDTLVELGAEMELRFDELVRDGYASVLPRGPAQTTADRTSFTIEGERDAEDVL